MLKEINLLTQACNFSVGWGPTAFCTWYHCCDVFDIFHIIISVLNIPWFYSVMLLCAVSQPLPNIRALHHTTITHSRPGHYETCHDMYVAATKTLSANGSWTLHNRNLQYATWNTLQRKYNFSAYSCYT